MKAPNWSSFLNLKSSLTARPWGQALVSTNHRKGVFGMLSFLRISFFVSFLTVAGHAVGQTTVPPTVHCPAFRSATDEYKLSRFNPPEQTISNIDFPGNRVTLFRGAYESNPQFSLEKILRGLFDEDGWYIGSPMFWGITQVLQGKMTLKSKFLPKGGLPLTMREYFSVRGILDDVETLLDCRRGSVYDAKESDQLAANLMNKVFDSLPANRIEHLYFDLKNPNYYRGRLNQEGFANNAIDFVIASTYDQVASLYGGKTMVLADKRDRGFDLGFWNKVHNGRWWDSWVDSGEINIPGYITADDVLGFQMRDKDRIDKGWGKALPNAKIKVAFYRTDVDGKRLTLVIDGGDEVCLIQAADGRYYGCDPRPLENIMSAPVAYPSPFETDFRHRAALLGVITDGDPEDSQIEAAISAYGKTSDKTLDPAIIARAEAVHVDGRPLRYVPARRALTPTTPSQIKIISAISTTNEQRGSEIDVTEKAAAFVDGRTRVTYKISSRFLRKIPRNEERGFVLTWICVNRPHDINQVEVEAPAEGKIIDLDCGGTP